MRVMTESEIKIKNRDALNRLMITQITQCKLNQVNGITIMSKRIAGIKIAQMTQIMLNGVK